MKGLPWFLSRLNQSSPYLDNPQVTSFAMNISHFSNANLTMKVLDGNMVSFGYKFWDFRGAVAVPAGSEVFLQTCCQEVDVTPHDGAIPITASNSTDYPLAPDYYRWTSVLFIDRESDLDFYSKTRIEMCMFGTGNFACCL